MVRSRVIIWEHSSWTETARRCKCSTKYTRYRSTHTHLLNTSTYTNALLFFIRLQIMLMNIFHRVQMKHGAPDQCTWTPLPPTISSFLLLTTTFPCLFLFNPRTERGLSSSWEFHIWLPTPVHMNLKTPVIFFSSHVGSHKMAVVMHTCSMQGNKAALHLCGCLICKTKKKVDMSATLKPLKLARLLETKAKKPPSGTWTAYGYDYWITRQLRSCEIYLFKNLSHPIRTLQHVYYPAYTPTQTLFQ